mgnify:CR=1 FL=1
MNIKSRTRKPVRLLRFGKRCILKSFVNSCFSSNLNKTLLMKPKRILGFVFIFLASLLTLAIVGQLPTLFGVLLAFFKIFTGKLDSSQIGEVVGHIIYWIIHILATIALWKYGVRWSGKQGEA